MTVLALACALLALTVVICIAVFACHAASQWNREVDELTRRADMWERIARGNGHDDVPARGQLADWVEPDTYHMLYPERTDQP